MKNSFAILKKKYISILEHNEMSERHFNRTLGFEIRIFIFTETNTETRCPEYCLNACIAVYSSHYAPDKKYIFL